MSRHSTIQDLAREAQVSVSTVDRILSGRGPVKDTTVEHVLAIAERIGFYGAETIRARRRLSAEEKTFGFLVNSQTRSLYRTLAVDIAERVSRSRGIRGRAIVRHVDDLDPKKAANLLMELGNECHAIACLCIDHPEINAAIKQISAKGVPVVCMISDVSAPERAGFVGANDWQLGRTAGWFMHRFCGKGGKVAMLVGSERYLCQQAAEASFRGFLRASAPRLAVLETQVTEESDSRAERLASELLASHHDLAGIFLAGGGVDGINLALRKAGRTDISFIATELSEDSGPYLASGELDLALDHPAREIAEAAVDAMITLTGSTGRMQKLQHIIPFRVVVSENC